MGPLIVAQIKVTPASSLPLTPGYGLRPWHPGVVGGRLNILAFPWVIIRTAQMILLKDETSFPHVSRLFCCGRFTCQRK
eukprot:1273731-Amphidinium_carterae.1